MKPGVAWRPSPRPATRPDPTMRPTKHHAPSPLPANQQIPNKPQSRDPCACSAYYRAKLDISSDVCLSSTLASVQPWTKFWPTLGSRTPLSAARKMWAQSSERPVTVTRCSPAAAAISELQEKERVMIKSNHTSTLRLQRVHVHHDHYIEENQERRKESRYRFL
jgi:hypothetical protein